MTNEEFSIWQEDYKRRKHEQHVLQGKLAHPQREFHVIKKEVFCYLGILEKENYSKRTIREYRQGLNRLDSYLFSKHKKKITSLDDIIDFLTHVKTSEAHLKCLRTYCIRFYNFLNGELLSTKRISKYKAKPLSPSLEKVLLSYYNYNRKRKNHPLTISKKEKLSREFLRKCNCDCLDDLTAEKMAEAVKNTTNKDEWGYARQFFRFCIEKKKISYDFGTILPKYKRRIKLPSTYSTEEISKIEFEVNRNTEIGKRDYALLLLVTRLGMRSSDIVDLRFSDIDFENKKIKKIQRKTGAILEIELVKEVEDSLIDYIENARPKSNSKKIFLRKLKPCKPFSTAVIRCGVVKKYMQKANIIVENKKHGPHSLRASLATSMVNDSVPFEAISKILGHTSKDTIQRYAKLDIEILRKCAVEVQPASGKFLLWLGGKENV